MKDQFLVEGESHRQEYEREFMNFLERLVNDLERRLRRGKDRLDIKSSDPTAALNPVSDELEEKRTIIDLQIKELLAKIEQCGEEGRVQEAQELMQEVEKYKAELEKLRQLEAENPSYRLEKRMEVCQTCGAFLIIGDALKRIEAHFEGRQHNGWARIREALADLKEKYSSGSGIGGHGARDKRAPSPEPGEIGEEANDRYVSNGRPSRSSRDHYYDEREGRGRYDRAGRREDNHDRRSNRRDPRDDDRYGYHPSRRHSRSRSPRRR